MRKSHSPRMVRYRLVLSRLAVCVAVWLSVASTSMFAQDSLDKLPETSSSSKDDLKVNLAEMRKVLRQLESDTAADRDAAEKRLIEMGPTVVPFLPEINSNTSGETKIRLERIRKVLQTTKIETYFEASSVTLSGKMPLSEALAALTKQTGNKISFERAESTPSTEVELKADKQPFWKVLDDLMTQAKLRLNTYSSMEGIVLMPDDSVLPGAEPHFSGPFQINVVSTQCSKPFYGRSDGLLDVSLQVAWEPRFKPIYIELPMNKMKLKVAGTDEISSANSEANPEIPVNSEGAVAQIDLQFPRPPRSVDKIDKLSGEFVMAVPSEKHKYVFEKFGNGKRQMEKYGEVTVTLENARRNGSVFEMRVLTEFDAAQGALDSFRGWILQNRAYLIDGKQNRLENVGFNMYSSNGTSVGVAFMFQLTADPNEYTMIYESPGMITKQSVKFELSDIDLP